MNLVGWTCTLLIAVAAALCPPRTQLLPWSLALSPVAYALDSVPIRQLEALIAAGDFESANKQVTTFLRFEDDLPTAQRGQLYLTKARLEVAFGRTYDMQLWLAKAFAATPEQKLDPLRDPPQMLAAWLEFEREKAALQPSLAQNGAGSGIALLPFGAGQFLRKDFGKALTLAGLESWSLFGFLTLHEPDRHIGLALFLGLWAYGVFDAKTTHAGSATESRRQPKLIIRPTISKQEISNRSGAEIAASWALQ